MVDTITRNKTFCKDFALGKPLEDALASSGRSTKYPQTNASIPMPTVGFDHRGCFKRISRKHFYHEGGESKVSFRAGKIHSPSTVHDNSLEGYITNIASFQFDRRYCKVRIQGASILHRHCICSKDPRRGEAEFTTSLLSSSVYLAQ